MLCIFCGSEIPLFQSRLSLLYLPGHDTPCSPACADYIATKNGIPPTPKLEPVITGEDDYYPSKRFLMQFS